jgi:hypothetical protein
MNFLDSICCKVVSNLTDANAKVANPANDGAIEVPAHLGLAGATRLRQSIEPHLKVTIQKILQDAPKPDPTKPTKGGSRNHGGAFVGFVGCLLAALRKNNMARG